MDIVIGRISPALLPESGAAGSKGGAVEATVLAVRGPRGGRSGQKQGEERRRRRTAARTDPPGSRVLTLLVTEPAGIPQDVDQVPYRVLLRFVRQA